MKKFSLIAGLGLLATVATVFAAWSFGYTATELTGDEDLEIAITVDTEFNAIGMHGTLALSGDGVSSVGIRQNTAKTSAEFDYSGSDLYTLTYTDPTDGNPDPETYSYTVNAVVSTNLDVVDKISVSSEPIALTITQDAKVQTVSVANLLAKISFGSITSEKQAQDFVDAVKAVSNPKITFTFSAAS